VTVNNGVAKFTTTTLTSGTHTSRHITAEMRASMGPRPMP
jgi:hypothetical protein